MKTKLIELVVVLAAIGALVLVMRVYRLAETPSESGAATSTTTANFRERGNLTDDLTLVYEKPGAPALTATLRFDKASQCDFGVAPAPCLELDIAIRGAVGEERVLIEGARVEGEEEAILVRLLKLELAES